ncbi:MAG: hypothetical protein ABIP08_01275, partial [Lautropia sp.]
MGNALAADLGRFIRKRKLAPGPKNLESWPWPIRAYTVGRLELPLPGGGQVKEHCSVLRIARRRVRLCPLPPHKAEVGQEGDSFEGGFAMI